MPKIMELPLHIANRIAAGEVVERPASVVKELLENAVDAGANKVTVELREGGMTYLRVSDDGCGMTREDAKLCFRRHATSKLRSAEELAAISTMGFRGEALAAIASVSRVDVITKPQGAVAGSSIRMEAGKLLEESEAGCPVGTTFIVRDLFFNTPARLKFMKQDSVEAAAVTATVQRQALAHPSLSVRLMRDGKEVLRTPGDGKLLSAMIAVFGRDASEMVPVDSKWEKNRVTGYVSKPSLSRPSRSHQVFFVNDRPVKSKLLQSALEEAYRNQMMVGKFPACVLHLEMPANQVDVNVHPAKTEVKFLREREVFDCIHYGCEAAMRKIEDRPELQIHSTTVQPEPEQHFTRMTAEEYRTQKVAQKIQLPSHRSEPEDPGLRNSLSALLWPDQPKTVEPMAPTVKIHTGNPMPPKPRTETPPEAKTAPEPPKTPEPQKRSELPELPKEPEQPVEAPVAKPVPEKEPEPEPIQEELHLPQEEFRVVGELFNTYIVVEQGKNAYLIDKHAAHERVLFEKFRARPREVASQSLITPKTCRVGAQELATLLSETALLQELGYTIEEFGENTLLLRACPMDLTPEAAAQSLGDLAQRLQEGCREDRDSLRDGLLHTMACKAAIKGGWHTDPLEREVLVREVLSRDELKYCPHGRPVCVKITHQQLDRQFGRC